MKIQQDHRKPLFNEFIIYVYPLLEVAIQWFELKQDKSYKPFLEKCAQRARTQSNFYGTIFELDMASRCLLSNWVIDFPEDYTKEGKQIDFIFYRHDKVAGVECLSKRYSENSLTTDKINKDITEKAKKFQQEYIDGLGISLDERLLIIDITTTDYSSPKILKDIKKIEKSSKLDAVILTWGEDIADDKGHSLRINYETVGPNDREYFSTTHASEFRITCNGELVIFFMRKYVCPEPGYLKSDPEEKV